MSHDRSFTARPPLAAWLVALAAALLHLAPLWRAQAATPPGWEFTGCLATSPDVMQYRVWERCTEFSGPISDNRFTTEPHRPYLPVFFYWGVGALARMTGAGPEFVYEWLGAPLAAALAMLLFLCARHFLPHARAAWCVFLATLLGGGFGAHLRIAGERRSIGGALSDLILSVTDRSPVWEQYRSHYVIKVLFDTHFLFTWVVTILALLAFYAAARRASAARCAAAAISSALTTLFHPYEGPLLLLACAGVWALARAKDARTRALDLATLSTLGATAATLAALKWMQMRSGLPVPDWRPPDVLFANVVLAYPLVAWLAVVGLGDYWRRAQLGELFLLGWAGACLAMTLSSPYYPYADRGPTTAQAPLFLIAGGIYFAACTRLSWAHACIALFVLGATPARELLHRARASGFSPSRPAVFLSSERRAVVDALASTANRESLLLAPPEDYRWLAPEHPGRCYDAHFFLTVDFERKRAEVDAFYELRESAESARFLDERGVDFLYAPRSSDPEYFAQLPGWRELATAHGGVLFTREAPR